LTNDLQGFAEAKQQPLQSPEDFVLEILERLRDEKFTLIAYSTAEMTIIKNFLNTGHQHKTLQICVILIC